jgi:peptidyl-dipeptidase Dcp
MFHQRLLLIAMTATVSAAAQAAPNPESAAGASAAKTTIAATAANPFLKASTLQYHAPPFDRISDADYQPAIEEGMKQQLAEIEKIAGQSAAPTFANTIEAMERSGATLTRVSKVFFALAQANTNETLQKVQSE